MRDPGDELGMALRFTRMIRLALEAMWSAVDCLPGSVTPGPGVRPALVAISQWLDEVEEGELRDSLLARNYSVIRPVSLVDPPSAESLADITAAICVLNGHALVVAS